MASLIKPSNGFCCSITYIENTDSFRTKTLKSRVILMDELTDLALN